MSTVRYFIIALVDRAVLGIAAAVQQFKSRIFTELKLSSHLC